jgi:hypothetical protein
MRGPGKFGGHLPWYFKATGWGLIGLSLVVSILLMVTLALSGFQPDVPRNRARRPAQRAVPADPAAKPATNNGGANSGQANTPPTPPKRDSPIASGSGNGAKPRKSYPVSIGVPNHSLLVPAKAKLPDGARLEACWSDKWNPITFLSANQDGSLNVRWDDFGPTFDCSMVRNELIVRKALLVRTGQLSPESLFEISPSPESGDANTSPNAKPLKSYPVTIAIPAGSRTVPANANFKPGARLQACWNKKWNPITFLSENKDGTLTVRWDDFGPAFDCRMSREELIVKQD